METVLDHYVGNYHITARPPDNAAELAGTGLLDSYQVHDAEHHCLAHFHAEPMAVEYCLLLTLTDRDPDLTVALLRWLAAHPDSADDPSALPHTRPVTSSQQHAPPTPRPPQPSNETWPGTESPHG